MLSGTVSGDDLAQQVLASTGNAVRQASSETDMQRMLQQCKQRASWAQYHSLPELTRSLQLIAVQFGEPTQAATLQALLARLVLEFAEDDLNFQVTEGIRTLYQASLKRILSVPLDQRELNDSFFKDLALASGHLFPAGERVVEPYSLVQRSLLYRAGLPQAARFIQTLLRSGGHKPMFRLHVHLSEMATLSQQTWYQTCVHLAQMLEINPSVKGVVGASWFYDPNLIDVSPHLAFINEQLRDNGGRWFFSHVEGDNSGAFAKSDSRRKAFVEGRYIPRVYVVLWPRDAALQWLQKHKDVA